MFLVGLTGGIASGKTSVANILSSLGIPVIDCDVLARKVVQPGRMAWFYIHKEFGDEVFLESGELNREMLGQVIFSDAEKRRKLNKITHPEIIKELWKDILWYFIRGYQYVVIDVPLLYETGSLIPYLHKIIVVSCTEEFQLQRLMARNHLSERDARARINAQLPLAEKRQKADFVVENSGSLSEMKKQAEDIYHQLRESQAHWKVRAAVGFGLGGLATLLAWVTVRLWVGSKR